MRWLIIGTGNVAWHLAQVLTQAGESCVGVVSREVGKARAFAETLPFDLPAYSFEKIAEISSNIDYVLLAVADDAITLVCEQLTALPTPLTVLHTSGTRPLSVLSPLANAGWKTGIFYPLQTLSRQKMVDWARVPLLLESEDLPTLHAIEAVGKRISSNVVFSTSEKRLWLHLVAVMTANFTHHLCTIGNQILEKQDLSIAILQPLIEETLSKALLPNGAQTQTGPARRGDTQTIERHLALLQDFPAWQKVYNTLTNSLLEMYEKA
jgi:predicted short-subunit dehydrogenase-like oxidoreductase (DUF2520 family)